MATTLRLPIELKARADAYAASLGISINALCAVALRDYLDARAGGRQPEADGVRRAARAASRSDGKTLATSKGEPPNVAAIEEQSGLVPERLRQPTLAEYKARAQQYEAKSSEPAPVQRTLPKVGANQPCPCGSGQKYKRCHGAV